MSQRINIYSIVTAIMWWVALVQVARAAPPPAGASDNGTDPVRVLTLPSANGAAPRNIFATHPKRKPVAAILILFPNSYFDAKALLQQPVWQQFAENHGLGLVSVPAFVEGDYRSITAVQSPLNLKRAALLSQVLDHEFGSSIKRILYSWPQDDVLAESVLMHSPKDVIAWCFHAPKGLPNASKAMPPGLLICYKEFEIDYHALIEDFTKGQKSGAKMTWIALPGDKPKKNLNPNLEPFVRNYIDALMNFQTGKDSWQNIQTKEQIRTMNLDTQRGVACYLPNVSLVEAWSGLHVTGGPTIDQEVVVECEVDTRNNKQPKLHLYLRKPLSATKQTTKIEGVLAISSLKKDRASLLSLMRDRTNALVRFAEEHHLAILTWDTASVWDTSTSADEQDRQQILKDDKSFDQLADAWEGGVKTLLRESEIPKSDFLLYGISRGAQWAHRLALRKPQYFLAVHIHVNSSYDWPTPAAKSILWLQTTGDRERGYEAAKRFYKRCREMGYPIIFKAGENLGHSDSNQIDAISMQFFNYALGVKAKRAVAASQSSTRKSDFLDTYTLSGMGAAPYFGDFINQDVYPAAQKEMIPIGQRVPLPNEAIAREWAGNAMSVTPQLISNVKATTVPAVERAQGNSSLPPQPTRTTVPAQPMAENKVPGPPTEKPSHQEKLPTQTEKVVKQPEQSPVLGRSLAERQKASLDQQAYAAKSKASLERAKEAYPSLMLPGSPMNDAFISEHRRLESARDALLVDASWPEQVADRVANRLGIKAQTSRK